MNIIVGENKFVNFINRWLSSMARQLTIVVRRRASFALCSQSLLSVFAIAIAFALSGCVKYETGINFYSLNHGEIIEHIQLGEQLNSFNRDAVRSWLASIEQRTERAAGRIERISARELTVIIPFHNARELTTKINRYFNPEPTAPETRSQFNSQLRLEQNNFFLIVRNHLTYDIDLRSLAVKSIDPNVAIATANSVDLDFSLSSPWGVKSNNRTNNVMGIKNATDRQVNWQLQPGSLNHIDAIFWLPNPLGIGTLLIILFSLGGYYLKYRQLPFMRSVESVRTS
jgi:Protein of unknown function (DUF3153)